MGESEWWRIEGWPTAEEWQAWWAMLTFLVAAGGVFFALRQLRQGNQQVSLSAEANERSAEANERAAEANARAAESAEAEARPYLSVRLELRATPPGDPKDGSGGTGLIYVVVESTGRTPARAISLHVTPDFRNSGRGRSPGEDPADDALALMFSGEPVIGMLSQGQALDYLLDFAEEAMNPKNGLPQRYEVTASYADATGRKKYAESHILDLAPWAQSILTPRSMDVIARQMRRLNQNLEDRPATR